MEKYFNINRYPDGQLNISVKNIYNLPKDISMRILSYEDLFILKDISDIYKHNTKIMPNLSIFSLFGSLSDRRFNNNEPFCLKNICEFINSCNFSSVGVLDPHSDVVLTRTETILKEPSNWGIGFTLNRNSKTVIRIKN